jgi:predicted NAD/FAD-binding protein
MNLHLPPHALANGTGRLKIAVVGSGISGASAAWALRDLHDVTLYEAEKRPGGHTATVDIDYDGDALSVDTGFIVYNELNYPNLTALFAHLGVKTHDSDMSFALSLDYGKLEWGGDNLKTLFAQKRNLLRPSFIMMLREILRFNKICLRDRADGSPRRALDRRLPELARLFTGLHEQLSGADGGGDLVNAGDSG